MRYLVSILLLGLNLAVFSCSDDEPDQPLGELIVEIDGREFRSTAIEATMVVSAGVGVKNLTIIATEENEEITLILQQLSADVTDACLPLADYSNANPQRTAGLDYTVDGNKQGVLQTLEVNITRCNTAQNRIDGNFTANVQTATGEIDFANGRFVNVLFQVQQ
jgi:hypothetical protein